MPTNSVTFASDEIDMRWKDPYLTEGLNQKAAYVVPRGIYRGFRLTTNATPRFVTVAADADAGDHVAVYTTATGYGLTIRRSGALSIDLSSAGYNSTTVVIAISAIYARDVTTVAYITIYTLAEYNALTSSARAELVVLGTVVVPAGSSLIAAASITPDRRTTVSESYAPEGMPWMPVVRNGGFEEGAANLATARQFGVAHWDFGSVGFGTDIRATLVTAGMRTGTKALALIAATNVAVASATITQGVHLPVVPGQMLKIRLYVKVAIAANAGSGTFGVYYADAAGAALGSATTVPLVLGSVDGSYRLVELTATVPATAALITQVKFEFLALQYNSFGTAATFDDVQVWVEPGSAVTREPPTTLRHAEVAAAPLILEDPSLKGTVPSSAALARFDSGSNYVRLERRDQDATQAPPDLSLLGTLKDLGAALLATDANALLARLSLAPRLVTGATKRTLILKSVTGAHGAVRLYHTVYDDGAFDLREKFEITLNAEWRTSGFWFQDQDVQDSVKLVLDTGDGTKLSAFCAFPGDGSGWTDSAWAYRSWSLPVKNPNATSGTNLIAPNLVAKAYGRLLVDWGGSTATLISGFNVASAAILSTPSRCRVTLTSGMGESTYTVVANHVVGGGSAGTGNGYFVRPAPNDATTFFLDTYNATATLVTSGSYLVDFVVFGIQTPAP